MQALDLKGLNCPLPVLRTRRALGRLGPGDLLAVEATDRMAALDIPHFCREEGHEIVHADTAGRVLRFTIRKGGTGALGHRA